MRNVLIASFVLFAAVVNAAAAADRPNIIHIMADDLGYGDLGCFGQQRIQTPHIDALAKNGMRLTSYYAGCTVCRPSRLVLWTGLHTGHAPINSNAQYVLQHSDTSLARHFKKSGYATGGVGKWSLGDIGTGGEPNRHGFDFWFGYLNQSNAHNYYPLYLVRCQGTQTAKVPLPGNVLYEHPKARGRVTDPKHRVTYSHDLMTDEAFGFIKRNRKNPFLLHIHWTIPHANNEGGRVFGDGMEVPDYGQYADQDWPNTEKGHAAMITRMDKDVGRLIALLKELQLDRNTFILFTSDNGPHNEGGHDHKYFDSNGPLRGYKRDLYEGGIRVPTIAWWPGVIEAGTTSDTPFAFYDFLPTAFDLAGIEPVVLTDGVSYAPTLRGRHQEQQRHESLYWKYGDKQAVRLGTWKGVRLKPNRPIELYDLTADIGETTDVAADHPEIVKQIEKRMQQATE